MLSRFFTKQKKTASSDKKREADRSDQASFGRLNDLGSEKIKSIIITLNQAKPIFESAGYSMEQLDVVFGIEPKLTSRFKKVKEIELAVYEEIIEKLEKNQLIRFILISLRKSEKMNSLFRESDLDYYGMAIDISSKPSVTSIFKKAGKPAQVFSIGK